MKAILSAVLLCAAATINATAQDQPKFLPQKWSDGDKVNVRSRESVKIWLGDSLLKEDSKTSMYSMKVTEDHKGFVVEGSYSLNPQVTLDGSKMAKQWDTLVEFNTQKAAIFSNLAAAWDKYTPQFRVDKSSSLATGWYNELEFMEENANSFGDAIGEYYALLQKHIDSIPEEDKEDHAYDEVDEFRDDYMSSKVDDFNSFLGLYTLKYQPYKDMKLPMEASYKDVLGDVESEQYYTVMHVQSKLLGGNKVKLDIWEEVPNDVIYSIHKGNKTRVAQHMKKVSDLTEEHKDNWLFSLNNSWPETHTSTRTATYGPLRIEVTRDETWTVTQP